MEPGKNYFQPKATRQGGFKNPQICSRRRQSAHFCSITEISAGSRRRLRFLESALASHLLGRAARRLSADWQIKYGHPAPCNLRQKTGRKPGGQAGRPGRTLQPASKPDKFEVHALDKCTCGLRLHDR